MLLDFKILHLVVIVHQQKKNVRPANRVRVRTPGVRPARPVRLVRLNSPFTALWRPLRCNTPHFCSFLCGSVRSPRPPLAPSIYFLPSSLRPMISHFCSFLCGSVRSPLPPDAIHLPPYRFSCTPQPPTFALFFADPSAVRLPPPTPFIFLLTHFPSPHNPPPLLNTPSAVLRTHPAPYLPTLPYSPLYAWR